MKIIMFADIHGNLSALKKLIDTDDFKTCDLKLFLGDAVSGCASPDDCVKLLNDFQCECLLGNNDLYVFKGLPADQLKKLKKVDQNEFAIVNLSQESIAIMREWKRVKMLRINDKTLYFVHYPWENDFDVIDDIDRNLHERQKAFDDIDADYYIFAHEHNYSEYEQNGKKYISIGSLGLSKNPKYYILNIEGGQISIEEKELTINWSKEKDLVEQRYPECVGKDFVLDVMDWIISSSNSL